MSQVVEYILSLKDQFTGGIEGANAHVNKLESSLKSAGGMLATLGIGFAIFKGAEFVHEGVEAFHALEQATAKVEANLKSTGETAGLGMKDITEMAKKLSSQVQFGRSEVMDMQSQLLTFPAITKDVFERSMGMVTDIAKQTNHGLSETAIMFGKAFNDPAKGLQKLMRYGVMFTDSQKDMIEKLQEGGHLIQAQQAMLDAIATSGYEGVAKAMANADPLFRYNKIMGSIKLSMGEAATSLLQELTPALIGFAEFLKSGIEFLRKYGHALLNLAKGLTVAFIVFKSFTIIPPILLAVENALVAASVSGVSFGASMMAALGPVALLAAAVGGLIFIFSQLGDKIKETAEIRNKFLDDSKDKEISYLKDIAEARGGGQKNIDAVAEEEKSKLRQQNKDLRELMDNSTTERGNEINLQIGENLSKMNAIDQYQQGLIKPKAKTMATVAPAERTKDTASKATGSKSVTINVSIKDLIGVQNINTTNIKEGAGKIKDLVVSALTGAVNDFQIVAGN